MLEPARAKIITLPGGHTLTIEKNLRNMTSLCTGFSRKSMEMGNGVFVMAEFELPLIRVITTTN